MFNNRKKMIKTRRKNNINWHSEETKKKIGLGNKGKLKNIKKSYLHKKHMKQAWTLERRVKFSNSKKGKLNPRYTNGKAMLSEINQKLNQKKLLDKNKKWECEICGNKNGNKHGQVLIVHHINKNRDDNRICNLMLVCQSCHVTIHNYQRWNKWRGEHGFSN